MPHKKKIFPRGLLASLEASLILLPAGTLFFFPFVETFRFVETYESLIGSAICALAFGLGLSLLILLPSTAIIETTRKRVTRQELAGALNTIGLVLVLGATLAYKGFTQPGEQGKILLFSLLMNIIFISYIFTVRYKHRTRDFPEPEPNNPS